MAKGQPVRPVAWHCPPAPSLDRGPYAINRRLQRLQRFYPIEGSGPEGVAVDGVGRIVVGYGDGRVVRSRLRDDTFETLANTRGRPLGMAPRDDGTVFVADALRGLLRIDPDGSIDVLSTQAEGLPYRFTNDLAVDAAGAHVYFTDSSSKWGVGYDTVDIIEHGGHGRLLHYNCATGTTSVLMKGLQFANGVALGPDDAYVLVAESGQYRVQRYWLKGPKAGTADVFVDNLPGFPDNISFNGRDRFWLAIAAPRNALLDSLSQRPLIRRIIANLPAAIQPKPARHGIVLAFGLEGKLVANVQHRGQSAFWKITSACEVGEWLVCGSVDENALARMPLHDVFAED